MGLRLARDRSGHQSRPGSSHAQPNTQSFLERQNPAIDLFPNYINPFEDEKKMIKVWSGINNISSGFFLPGLENIGQRKKGVSFSNERGSEKCRGGCNNKKKRWKTLVEFNQGKPLFPFFRTPFCCCSIFNENKCNTILTPILFENANWKSSQSFL